MQELILKKFQNTHVRRGLSLSEHVGVFRIQFLYTGSYVLPKGWPKEHVVVGRTLLLMMSTATRATAAAATPRTRYEARLGWSATSRTDLLEKLLHVAVLFVFVEPLQTFQILPA